MVEIDRTGSGIRGVIRGRMRGIIRGRIGIEEEVE